MSLFGDLIRGKVNAFNNVWGVNEEMAIWKHCLNRTSFSTVSKFYSLCRRCRYIRPSRCYYFRKTDTLGIFIKPPMFLNLNNRNIHAKTMGKNFYHSIKYGKYIVFISFKSLSDHISLLGHSFSHFLSYNRVLNSYGV